MGLLMPAYTTADLQMVLSILAHAAHLEPLRQTISMEIERRTRGAGSDPCPSCHRGHLVPWPLISREAGGLVVGCRLCMYSRMEVGDGDSAR